jgi:hypothetical protein
MDLSDLFADQLTSEIKDLARHRITDGGDLSARKDLTRATRKLAILLVIEVNPYEVLSQGEAVILYGIGVETLRKRQKAGDHPNRINCGH